MKIYQTVLIALALFMGGCGVTSSPEVISYPSWYLNPPQNTGSSLYGVGEGHSIEVAKAAALNSVSQSLSLRVSSTLKKEESSRRVNGNENTFALVMSSLKVQTKAMEFSEYTIVNNQQIGRTIVLLVKVSRQQLFKEQKTRLERLMTDLESDKKRIDKEPILKQALLFSKRSSKGAELESSALLTKTINSNFDEKPYLKAVDILKQDAQKAFSAVKISIIASPSATVFVEALNQGLNDAGIQTGGSKANTQLYVKNTFATDEIYGFKIAKANLSLSIKQKKKLVSSNNFSLTGKSKYDYEKAKFISSKLLAQKIQNEGIFSVLGVK